MQVFRHVNSIFTSNTYLLSEKTDKRIYAVDPGSDSKAVLDWLKNNNRLLAGIILTHAHHDHIYGINDLLVGFPDAKLYVTQKMITPLLSAKANMSEYMERPLTLNTSYLSNIKILIENGKLLLWNKVGIYVLNTPGHTIDSITFRIDNYVFSGDSLIPGMRIVYRKKAGGDPVESANSISNIYKTFNEYNVLLPGHGGESNLAESKQVNVFCQLNYNSGFCKI